MSGHNWQRYGACTADPRPFFPDGDTGPWLLVIDEAKTTCKTRCPVLDECFVATLAAERGTGAKSRHGIFAGLDPEERAALDPTPRRRNQHTKTAA